MPDPNDPWLAPAPDPQSKSESGGEGWARESLERVALAAVVEQRRGRRWGIFFKLLFFVYVGAFFYLLLPDDWGPSRDEDHVALVKVDGVIVEGAGTNARDVNRGLKAAFEDANTRGVIVQVNSPGGSAVQAGLIYDEIQRLRAQHPDTPVYAVIDDVGASGGYYVAAAADAIYANRASIVGSIGVRADGFGFTRAMESLGIERRLLTAGEFKGFLDPFSARKEREVAHMQVMLDAIHEQFIHAVRQGRGERLVDAEEAFSGLVWTGAQSVDIGLIDGLNNVTGVARELIGVDRIVEFSVGGGLLDRLAQRVGSTFTQVLYRLNGIQALY